MRGLVPGLDTPREMVSLLPALLQGDPFAQRLTSAFDDVLAPILSTLDNLDAYLDPTFAPYDFVDWLALWVGLAIDENWPLERRRDMVAHMTELYSWRGTARGLRALVALQVGVEPEIEESGGVSWSPVPGGELPGSSTPSLVIRLRVPDPAAVNLVRLDALIAAARPAHIPHRLEVVPA
jgi:phage tail-like protein